MSKDLPFERMKSFTFVRVPISLPADYRTHYKVAVVLLILQFTCRGSTGSMLKLQFMNWLLKNDALRQRVLKAVAGSEAERTLKVIHLDPALNRAIDFALGERLIQVSGTGKVSLTKRGEDYTNRIIVDAQLLSVEKSALLEIGKSVTDVRLEQIFRGSSHAASASSGS